MLIFLILKPFCNESSNHDDTNLSVSSLIQKKDANFSIFRGLGKVLHRKNMDISSEQENIKFSIEDKLPAHLKKKYYRKPLLYDPDEILSKTPVSEDLITLYLHQNYLDLFALRTANNSLDEKLESLIEINENFMLTDRIESSLNKQDMSNHVSNLRYKELPALLSIRSILFHTYCSNDEKCVASNSSKKH
jgi:hypothetical protein